MLDKIKSAVLKFIEDNFKKYHGDKYWTRHYSNGDVVSIHVHYIRRGRRHIRLDIFMEEIDGETGRITECSLEDASVAQFGGHVIETMKGSDVIDEVNQFWEEHVMAVYNGVYY